LVFTFAIDFQPPIGQQMKVLPIKSTLTEATQGIQTTEGQTKKYFNVNSMKKSRIQILFGLQVRNRRIQIKMTQEKLARKIGTARSYISGVEHGKRNVSLKTMADLAGALKVPISTFFPANVPTLKDI